MLKKEIVQNIVNSQGRCRDKKVINCTIQDKKVNLQMQIKPKCAKSTTLVKFNYILMWNLDGVI